MGNASVWCSGAGGGVANPDGLGSPSQKAQDPDALEFGQTHQAQFSC